MASKVENPHIAAAINTAAAGLASLLDVGVHPESPRDAVHMVRELEQLRRVTDALCVEALSEIDKCRWHIADGHATPKSMVGHLARLSPGEAMSRSRMSKMAANLPDVWDHYRSGAMGSDHARALALVHANPRVRDAMPARQKAFINEARSDYDTFNQRIHQWKRLTDQDGPTPPNQRHHQDRNARVEQDYDLAFHVMASFACQQGLQISEIFNKYVDAENLADWEKARAEHGDEATRDHLPRTIQQRRADAMWQIFIDAAANPNSAVPADFVHNIIWDSETFEHLAAKVLGEDADLDTTGNDPTSNDFLTDGPTEPFDDLEESLFDGIDPDTMVCRTIDGVDLEPTEMMINAIISKIRRVVIDAAGERVDLGKARFFTGMARHAVKLKATHCIWPGCCVPSSACQADHLIEHSKDGRTHPGNGAPLCGKHNRLKQNGGFTIYRSPDGQWHIIRPDGTTIPN